MHDARTQMIRLIVLIGALAVVPFFLALRAMGREIGKDARRGGDTGVYSGLAWKFAGILLWLGLVSWWYRSWLPIIAFGWLPATFATVILLNNRRRT